jgi:hypothetical protein
MRGYHLYTIVQYSLRSRVATTERSPEDLLRTRARVGCRESSVDMTLQVITIVAERRRACLSIYVTWSGGNTAWLDG